MMKATSRRALMLDAATLLEEDLTNLWAAPCFRYAWSNIAAL